MKPGRGPAAVLEEDDFRAAVDAIVQRDFFPDLVELQAENLGVPVARAGAAAGAAGGPSLNEFLRTHISEDSASFSRLLTEENQRRSSSSTTGGQLRLLGRPQLRNALMFAPDGLSAPQRAPDGRIVHRNTRLPEDAAGDPGDAESVVSDASTAGYQTPVIRGYKMVDPDGPRRRARYRAARTLPQRAAMLSPAAHRLLGRSPGRGAGSQSPAAGAGSSESLRRAYNSPYVRRPS
ncbi:hypothetical protein H4R21_003118 [Coemansia helicoidea]|uniref:Uncharacterized protein n=1 Tax=Coemansia helicoidea TaxID=1286919 RepID=A0ACC1L538_9FUNG|nr:hypothetical protein H4R21_003118 [Coemansia helicoidea]